MEGLGRSWRTRKFSKCFQTGSPCKEPYDDDAKLEPRVHGVTDGWWWWPVKPGIHFPFAVASQWERDTHWAPNTRIARRWMMQAGLFAAANLEPCCSNLFAPCICSLDLPASHFISTDHPFVPDDEWAMNWGAGNQQHQSPASRSPGIGGWELRVETLGWIMGSDTRKGEKSRLLSRLCQSLNSDGNSTIRLCHCPWGEERDNGVAMAKAEHNKWLGRYYYSLTFIISNRGQCRSPPSRNAVRHRPGGGGDQQAHKPTRRGRQSESYLRNTLSRA